MDAKRRTAAEWADAIDEASEHAGVVGAPSPDFGIGFVERMQRDYASLEALARRLAEALKECGCHLDTCDYWKTEKCTCGYGSALAEAKEAGIV